MGQSLVTGHEHIYPCFGICYLISNASCHIQRCQQTNKLAADKRMTRKLLNLLGKFTNISCFLLKGFTPTVYSYCFSRLLGSEQNFSKGRMQTYRFRPKWKVLKLSTFLVQTLPEKGRNKRVKMKKSLNTLERLYDEASEIC